MEQRRSSLGFTLIELLIVITIIALLAGMLITGIPLAQRKLAQVRCGNNLQQIGVGIEIVRQEKEDQFPGRLVDLFDKRYNGPYEPGLQKILICPADSSAGNNGFNRMGGWTSFQELREDKDFGRAPARPTPVHWTPCSYMYETSEQVITDQDLLDTLYRGEPTQPTLSDKPTWAMGKRAQQRSGNLAADNISYGEAFAPSQMPILRCYWHNRWTTGNDRTDAKVINLSWDLNVFFSIPYWEHTANPNIPIN